MIEFKGSNEGIRVIIDHESSALPPDALQQALKARLDDLADFLAGAEMVVELMTDQLTAEVVGVVTQTLTEYPDMTLKGIVCHRTEVPRSRPTPTPKPPPDLQEPVPVVPRASSDQSEGPSNANGPRDRVDIHFGTLRGGQSVFSPRSLMVIGNVNPGARVSAGGNVYIFGSLQGVAAAGVSGDTEAFIYAETMNPLQLYIGDKGARNTDRQAPDEPEYAVVDEGQILVYPVTRRTAGPLQRKSPAPQSDS